MAIEDKPVVGEGSGEGQDGVGDEGLQTTVYEAGKQPGDMVQPSECCQYFTIMINGI